MPRGRAPNSIKQPTAPRRYQRKTSAGQLPAWPASTRRAARSGNKKKMQRARHTMRRKRAPQVPPACTLSQGANICFADEHLLCRQTSALQTHVVEGDARGGRGLVRPAGRWRTPRGRPRAHRRVCFEARALFFFSFPSACVRVLYLRHRRLRRRKESPPRAEHPRERLRQPRAQRCGVGSSCARRCAASFAAPAAPTVRLLPPAAAEEPNAR